MTKIARDVMTPNPVCCSPETTLDQVARLMRQNDCGEIPILDSADHPIGVVTDRDIVCRVVADGKNPMAHTAETCMTQSVVTVLAGACRSSTSRDAAPASSLRPTSRGPGRSAKSRSSYGKSRGIRSPHRGDRRGDRPAPVATLNKGRVITTGNEMKERPLAARGESHSGLRGTEN